MTNLRINISKCRALTTGERAEMFSLFSRYYENIDSGRFEGDLQNKDWTIFLQNGSGDLVGFSTLQVYRHDGEGGTATVLYSGDTVVDRAYRGSGALAGAFGHFVLRVLRQNPTIPVYWLLTSKGVRTYRFLPVFFKTFFPAPEWSTPPDIKRLIDSVATQKFGTAYSAATQVVSYRKTRDHVCHFEHHPQLLQRRDPYIRFFLKVNPGYSAGNELVCIAPVFNENLNAKARHVIQRTEVQWRE